MRVQVAVLTGWILGACTSPSEECLTQTRGLRHRIESMERSVVPLYARVDYAQIPVGDGTPARLHDDDYTPESALIIDGSTVWHSDQSHDDGPFLDKWLSEHAGIFHTIRYRRPFVLFVTSHTRLALVKRVAKLLHPLGDVRLGVRPGDALNPWQPRSDRKDIYLRLTSPVRPEALRKRTHEIISYIDVAAEGCSEAEDVAAPLPDGMSPMARLRRVPDAFAKCGCKGDMETMAALYWFSINEHMVPIRWHLWDDALVAELGDDATYADLAKVLTERYRASQRK